MFKVDMLVEDKNLTKVLKSLAGNVNNMSVVPVQGMEPTRKRLAHGGPNTAPMVIQNLLKTAVAGGKTTISTSELAGDAEDVHGMTYQAAQYGIKIMKERGFIVPRTRGLYSIDATKL